MISLRSFININKNFSLHFQPPPEPEPEELYDDGDVGDGGDIYDEAAMGGAGSEVHNTACIRIKC